MYPIAFIPHYFCMKLAEMNVHQVRAFFIQRDGYIVDNPKVGPTLAKGYWEHGNARDFLDLVKDVTGKELSGDAWVARLKETVEECLASEKKEYEKALAEKSDDSSCENLDLNMIVRFVDGDTLISDSSTAKDGLLGACKDFESFLAARASA
jgi:hypothetical protein